jgi:hypothetical protein
MQNSRVSYKKNVFDCCGTFLVSIYDLCGAFCTLFSLVLIISVNLFIYLFIYSVLLISILLKEVFNNTFARQ